MPLNLPSSPCRAAVIAGVMVAASVASAAQPVLLRPPPAATELSPFEAALSNNRVPLHNPRRRVLGRPDSHGSMQSPASDDDDGILWGHSPISLTQYPLTEPRADRALDEPATLAPGATDDLTCDVVCDQPSPLLALGDTRIDATSLTGSGDTLGITSIVVRPAIESSRIPGTSLRPIFGMHMLSGPEQSDLPGQVYDFSLEGRMYLPFGDRWLTELALAPGFYSDLRNTDDAIRVVARVIAFYKKSETLRFAIGGTYLDREDIDWLPIAGVVWVPSEDWRYELVFPRPRITHRIWCEGPRERWAYLLGELGGGSWAIERASGAADIATYRDYRLLLGLEFKQREGHSWLVEAGIALARELEYRSHLGDYSPDPTAIVRAAVTF